MRHLRLNVELQEEQHKREAAERQLLELPILKWVAARGTVCRSEWHGVDEARTRRAVLGTLSHAIMG